MNIQKRIRSLDPGGIREDPDGNGNNCTFKKGMFGAGVNLFPPRKMHFAAF